MTVGVPTPSYQRGQRRTQKAEVTPAPIEGIDGRFNLSSDNPLNCIYAYNLVPAEYGMRTRSGFRDWQTNIETAPGQGTGVRTLVPYRAVSGLGSAEKLFSATNEGIWDCTVENGSAVLKFGFSDQGENAGWGHYVHYTTDAGESLIYYADEANGLVEYTPGTDTWAAPTGITGLPVTDIVFVVVHKQRIWFVERGSTNGWYLPVGAKSGAVTKFTFGGKFKHGGDLVGLYTWTLDSGEGVDDILVAVSRGGDVLPYKGEDPSQAVTWSLIGSYYIGEIPLGRRIGTEYGGDLNLISDFGLVSMNDLLQGVSATREAQQISQKIARFLRNDVDQYSSERGWEVRFEPHDALLLINTPIRTDGTYLQYRVNLSVNGFGFWRGVPGITFEQWRNRVMIGTADNRVLRMDVPVDNVTAADPDGQPIEFSMLTNFLTYGSPAIFKYGDYIRPNFLALQSPAYTAKFLYDYVDEILPAPGPVEGVNAAIWDTALWDQAIWGSELLQSYSSLRGGWGPGRTVAVALRGLAYARTTFVSADVMWHEGSPY